jgi:head-tail adaptor
MKIEAGKMRLVFDLESPSVGGGPLGQTVWETFDTGLRGSLTALTGREQDNTPQLGGSDCNYEWLTRYRPGVKADMRVVFGTRKFVIRFTTVETEEAPRLLHIFCREIMTA